MGEEMKIKQIIEQLSKYDGDKEAFISVMLNGGFRNTSRSSRLAVVGIS